MAIELCHYRQRGTEDEHEWIDMRTEIKRERERGVWNEYTILHVQHANSPDCGAKVPLKAGETVRCKECGYRVLYKPRTYRSEWCWRADRSLGRVTASTGRMELGTTFLFWLWISKQSPSMLINRSCKLPNLCLHLGCGQRTGGSFQINEWLRGQRLARHSTI